MRHSQKTLLCAMLGILPVAIQSQRPGAQSSGARTEIVVVGTVHEPTPSFREKTLLEILGRVKPDVVLLEIDRSFFDDSSTLSQRYETITLETRAATAYAKSAGVALRPYDIEGRNKFYQDNDYFARELKLNQDVSRLYARGELSLEARLLVEALRALSSIRDACGADTPEVFNSAACDSAVAHKQQYAFKGLAKVINLTPALADMRAFGELADGFWIRRNTEMVRNIVKYAKELHARRVVVLAGYEHRYYLREHLAELATSEGFVLREYRDY